KKFSILILRITMLFFLFFAALIKIDVVWLLGDIGGGMTAWLNLFAILFMQGIVIKCLRDFQEKASGHRSLEFNSEIAGIENADFWKNK
ncbi:MAG: alanine:cation symporter family protein, partial [Anaerovoracaceae bacterium]